MIMKKWLCLLLMVSIIGSLMCGSGAAAETPAEDFSYDMVDGSVVITGYHGSDREIVIPKEINGRPVVKIGERAFEEYDLTSIVISENVSMIDRFAFSNCACLEKVEFAEGPCLIVEYAFHMCNSLVTIELPKNSSSIQRSAFSMCDNLEEIYVPDDYDFTGLGLDYMEKFISGSDKAVFVITKNSAMYNAVQEALENGEDIPVKIK